MNHIYRLRWNRSLARWVVTSELTRRATRGQGARKRSSIQRRATALVALALGLTYVVSAAAGPTGGHITTGSGQILQSGNTTTIQQNSPTLSLNWQSFNVGTQETVNFVQPSSSSLAVNRIFSATASEILGHVNSNGQVWLINPNGVLFGEQAQVNVGGLVASTLDLVNDGSSDTRKFRGDGTGTVVNEGTITAAKGGYVALMGHQVSNQGVITAQLGTVALGAGSAQTLTFSGNRLLHLQVDASALNDLVENGKLIQANGGRVFMTAGAKDAVLASVVNNTGIVQAETVENHNGTILLLGGGSGTVNVGGTLDASAPHGGDGGSVETSGATVNIGAAAKINAGAPSGKAGTWLVDPEDLTIDATAAGTIQTSLNAGTNVTEQTTSGAASGVGNQTAGAGDINVNSAISWTNPAATLTLTAYHGINVNAAVSGAGHVAMSAASGNLTLGAAISGQAGVTLSTGANFVNNAGASAVSAGSGSRWLVYSTNPTQDTTGGLTPGFIQYNAPALTTPTPSSGSGFLYSVAPTLAVTALSGPVTKTYDGTTVATLAGSNMTVTGLLNGDTITSAAGTYASPNAATGINVTSPTDVSTLVVANGSIPVYGYALSGSTVTAAVGTISPKQLTAAIVATPTKVYDGTTTATLSSSNYSFNGFVGSEGATVSQPSSVGYASADASQNAVVNATFTSTNFTATAGTNLANYVLPTSATGAGIINQAPVNLTGLLANNKTYDGTNTAILNTTNAGIFGVIQPDAGNVTLDKSGAAATFSQSNAGNNLAVTVTPNSFQLTGSKAANYTLVAPNNLTANISPNSITVSNVKGTNKVYDGTTSDPLNFASATLSGVLAGDTANVALSTATATGTFQSQNAATGIGVSVSGIQLSGTAASNYSLSQPTGITANITPAPLSITLGGTQSKLYNGTTTATVPGTDFTITGFIGSESASITQNASAEYASPNVGTHIGVTATLEASDFTAGSGTLMSNYSFPHAVTGTTGTITAIPLSASITNNPTKTYDGNTNATVASNDYVLTGFIGSESASINQPTGTYASANAGPETVTANVTASNYTAGSGTLLSNYILPTTISGQGMIQQAPLTGTNPINGIIIGNPTKTYDGTNVATLTPANFQLSGFVAGQGATVTQTVGQYATTNAGAQAVTVNLTSGDFAPNAGTNLANYTLPTVVYGTGTINPAQLTATIIGNPTKVYDGSTTTVLSPSNYQLSGFAGSEGATINASSLINYDSKNVGARNITADLTTSAFTANSGTLLSNYVLPTSATGTGQITPAPLYVIGVSANNKIYDSTTAATLNISNAGLGGLVTGESSVVTLNTTTSGTFSQADVGNGIAVTTNGFSISGTGASNYSLQTVTGLHANISPALLTIQQVTANDKPYDGTSAGTLTTTSAVLQGILNSDNVTLDSTGATGTFASVNAGTGIPVTANGFTLGGIKAGDYTVSQPTGLSATINPKTITATIIGNPTKAYDGSNSATLTNADYQLNGFVGGQGATVPQSATANYLSPNAGTNIGLQSTLVISDFVANAGTNLSNYVMPSSATGTLGTITPKILNLTGTRVYDTTTDANGTLFGTLTGLNGDTLTVSGTGTLVSKNVGTENFASLNTLALVANGSALASNYTLVGGTDWVKITPVTLTVTGTTGSTKIYDGTTTAAISNATLNGVLGSDNVTLGNDTSGNFLDKNVGTNKPIVTAMTLGGTDTGNYVLTQPTDATGNITAQHITVTATGTNRQYDGTVNDSATLSSAGLATGDSVTFTDTSATFADPNVANNKTVTVLGISATGTDAGNYILDNTTTTTTANVTPKILNLTGTRVYDALTDADAALFGNHDGTIAGVNGETLLLAGSGTLTSKNVNTRQTFSLNGLALGDSTGLASNYTLIGGTDWVNVTRATLNVINAAVTPKTYDGTTAAQITGATLQGVLLSDSVTLGNDTTGTFANKNVGTGKTVTTAMTIGNTDAGNYTLVQPTLTGDISSKTLTVNATGVSRTYNGLTSAAVTLSSTDIASGDTITFSDTSATFADKNVSTGIPISVQGISIGGASAGNYTLNNTTAATSADITAAIINLTGTRVYNGLTTASASLFGTSGVVSGVNGETLNLTGTGTLSSKDVNSHQTFSSLNTLSLSDGTGAASNYTLVGGTDWVNITPLHITVAANGANKVYDGGVLDPGLTLSSSGIISGDTVTFAKTSATFADRNVADGKTVSVSGISISGGGSAGDYVIDNTTATTTANITPKPLTITASGSNKTYDGNANDAVTLSAGVGAILSGDSVTIADTSATFSDANAGNGKTVTASGISLSGTSAGNYSLNNTVATTTANIAQAVINLSGTRAYDGTANAYASMFGSNGVVSGVNGETLRLNGSGTLPNKNVNPSEALTSLGSLTLANGSGLATNYTLIGGTDNASVTPLHITVGANGVNKVYDGGVLDPGLTLTSAGVVTGDLVTFADTSATFANKNAGTGKTISVSGISISGGADASNYVLDNITTTTSANITPRPITVSATGTDKVYDAGVNDVVTLTSGQILAGDTITFGDASATFADKNIGNAKTVTVSGISASGPDASNYSYNTGATTAANITPAQLTIVNTQAASKTYDGSTSATLSGATLQGILGTDSVTLANASTGTFATANAGTGKAVATAMTIGGADAGNYVFTQPSGLVATISPVVLDLSGTRQYDATTNANANLLGNDGVLTGVNGETLTLSGIGTLSGKNVSAAQTFNSLSGFTLTGNGSASASNYTLAGGTDRVQITPAPLTVANTQAASKVYDGNTVASLSGATLLGVLSGDDVALGNDTNGVFADKNAGTGKNVTTAMTVTGADANNYTLAQPTGLAANITAKPLTVEATGSNKVYDGNTMDRVTLASNGVVSGDSVYFTKNSANFSTSSVGNAKTVTVNGIQATGSDADNYTLTSDTAITTADITSGVGVQDTAVAVAYLDASPAAIATPYGVAPSDSPGQLTANKKLVHRPVERNQARSDFRSGLSLQIVDGGVRMPAQ